MENNKITKPKTLDDQLVEKMTPGETIFIDEPLFRSRYVIKVVARLNQKGYSFHATQKGLFQGVNVTRLK